MGSLILLESRLQRFPAPPRSILTAWVFGLLLIGVAFLVFVPPIAQDQGYHVFADTRTFFGVPNFWDVASNLVFAVVGILGLRRLRDTLGRALFLGVLLTCFGSGYYHLAPNDARLVWDRLPMTLVFMSLTASVIGAVVGPRWDRRLLAPLVIAGIASVLWWRASGDLRPYIVVQFGSMLLLLSAFPFFKSARGLWPVLGLYVLAKLAENYDRAIYSLAPISGHTCKHLLAGLATYWILRWHSTNCKTATASAAAS